MQPVDRIGGRNTLREAPGRTPGGPGFRAVAANVLLGFCAPIAIVSGLMAARPWQVDPELIDRIAVESFNVRCCVVFSGSLVATAVLLARPRR